MADFSHLHFGLPAAPFSHHAAIARRHSTSQLEKRAPNPACATGGFVTSPSRSQTFNFPGTSTFNITWDPTCLDAETLDIYLYAYTHDSNAASTKVHLYTAVPNSLSTYSAPIMPKWWLSANATTSTTSLQVLILPKDDPIFMATFPPGPIFSATYTAPSDGSVPPEADTSIIDGDQGTTNFAATNNPDGSLKAPVSDSGSSVSPGGKAAAVIFPLLFVLACGLGYWFWRKRQQGKEDRKRFSEMVDKRMSVISKDWQSMSAKAGMEAVRNSTYDGRSSFAAGDRGSTFGSGQAGVGVMGGSHFNVDVAANPALAEFQSHLRRGVTTAAMAERKSKVSFAADTIDRKSRGSVADVGRPSMDRTSRYDGRPSTDTRASRYGGVGYGGRSSRAFHTAFTVDGSLDDVPALPGSTSPVSHLTTASYAASNGHDNMNGKKSLDFPNPYSPNPMTTTFSGSISSHGDNESEDGSGTMSPTQTQGPASLSVEDIRKRIGGTSVGKTDQGNLDGEVMPALRLMRTGSKQKTQTANQAAASEEGSDELLFSPSQFQFESNNAVTVPPPAHATSGGLVSPRSPGPVGMMPTMTAMTATPDSVMSPDALLRAYAERRATGSAPSPVSSMRSPTGTPTPLTISSPITASTPYSHGLSSPVSNNNMRTLYSPAGGNGGFAGVGAGRAGVGAQGQAQNVPRQSMSVYSVGMDEEDAYGGHA
ncbi:hypothetical protein ONZ45_g14409 [Pleurotus djamor]|nr:hypothetical protein ONZ45_g14409 [Pleurotus djamor]